MSAQPAVNRCIVLARRPQGAPTAQDFRLERQPVPAPGPNQVLLRTRYLSLDPYMRGRMNEGPSYVEPVAIGAPMGGQTVSVVEASNASGFRVGDVVLANVGWQDYGLSDGGDLVRIDNALAQPSHALGVLGMPGLTAYVGLLDIGLPKAGETVVVAAATGAVGSVVGQIAKIKGCRAVGIAGGHDKCEYALNMLGFDACLDHHEADLPRRLAAACPKGIDVYFESVGGAVLAAVLPLLNRGARMPLCGLIAWYNLEKLPEGGDRTAQLLSTVLRQRVKVQGFIVLDHHKRAPAFREEMSGWLREGRVRYREQVIEGLENAPQGLMGLLRGENFGKLLVRVSGS
ncbi:MAG TPA: NADP-dependent oxidoreductase [Steroidobacteraceae bacterium]